MADAEQPTVAEVQTPVEETKEEPVEAGHEETLTCQEPAEEPKKEEAKAEEPKKEEPKKEENKKEEPKKETPLAMQNSEENRPHKPKDHYENDLLVYVTGSAIIFVVLFVLYQILF